MKDTQEDGTGVVVNTLPTADSWFIGLERGRWVQAYRKSSHFFESCQAADCNQRI